MFAVCGAPVDACTKRSPCPSLPICLYRLSKSEKKFKEAALANVRAEVLLPEEAGFVEAEGEMERTYRFQQKEVSSACRSPSQMCHGFRTFCVMG
jgi:hypothetical protein